MGGVPPHQAPRNQAQAMTNLPHFEIDTYPQRGHDAVFFRLIARDRADLHLTGNASYREAWTVLETQEDRAEMAARLRAAADTLSPLPAEVTP